jgi:diaminopimelate decarboxylase
MTPFTYKNAQLFCEQSNLIDLANEYATPLYVYSKNTILNRYNAYQKAFSIFDTSICYAIKANSNLAILNLLADAGAGFDVVSQGEMQRVLTVAKNAKIVFSGVAKTEAEIEFALTNGVYCLNVESFPELKRIALVAERINHIAPISLRVNPDVDVNTHPYISTGLKENKFGVAIDTAKEVYLFAQKHKFIAIKGVDCHIGSQLIDISPYKDALVKVLALVDDLKQSGIIIEHIDIGGGLGVKYQDETPPEPQDLVNLLKTILPKGIKLILEPGRSIIADAGVLLTKIEYLKETEVKNFAIVDAGMNDLIRPSLYSAWQNILPLQQKNISVTNVDIVGPVCESTDFLGKERNLAIEAGDFLAVMSSGAYGFTMSSQYNSRRKPCELLVDGNTVKMIRKRDNFADLIHNEIYD